VAERDETNKAVNANNAAVVVTDPKTGEILSFIGSKNYFEDSYPKGCDELPAGSCLFDPKYDVVSMGLRQPGSSFKPFVYATAFKKGFTPDTVLWDVKTEFNPNCSPLADQEKDIFGQDCYHPYNYDQNFRGRVSLRNSIAQSLNLPSVKLLYLAGLNNVLQTARDFGFTTLNDPARYGLSLVLGGGEVNLLELTSAYGVFAREGMKIPPVSILKIEDNNGNIIEQNQKQATKVLDTQIARQINDILSDNKARSPIFGENSMLYFPGYDVAAKTGTTESYKDAWTMGYTPFAVVGVWVGNSDNSPIDKKTGIGLAAPIWRKIMEKLLISNPIENFTDPDPILETKPALSGKLDSSDTHTILYYINKDDILGPQPQDPQKDQQYFNWQSGIDNWLRSHSQY
jgi:membrane peptidoglycan carboxypeptidase